MRARGSLAALAAGLVVTGCGLGAGKGSGEVSLVVTRDFGQGTLGQVDPKVAPGSETVMRYLQRNFKVRTSDGGGFVQAIDGLAGGREKNRPVDWFYYVNGVEAPKGAASTRLHPGDRVLWDRHDWGVTMRVPAIVGSFPEPFVHGDHGKRLPVRVECASDTDKTPCRDVAKRLTALGANAASSLVGTEGGNDTLRVVVGLWPRIRGDRAVGQLERGPKESGVYAVPATDGRSIRLLDPRGRTARVLLAGGGLVAATAFEAEPPTWVITGTDARGLRAAVAALDEGTLTARFAVALAGPGKASALPVAP